MSVVRLWSKLRVNRGCNKGVSSFWNATKFPICFRARRKRFEVKLREGYWMVEQSVLFVFSRSWNHVRFWEIKFVFCRVADVFLMSVFRWFGLSQLPKLLRCIAAGFVQTNHVFLLGMSQNWFGRPFEQKSNRNFLELRFKNLPCGQLLLDHFAGILSILVCTNNLGLLLEYVWIAKVEYVSICFNHMF